MDDSIPRLLDGMQILNGFGELALAIACLITAIRCTTRGMPTVPAWLLFVAFFASFAIGTALTWLPRIPAYTKLGPGVGFGLDVAGGLASVALMVVAAIALLRMRPVAPANEEGRHG